MPAGCARAATRRAPPSSTSGRSGTDGAVNLAVFTDTALWVEAWTDAPAG